MYGIDNTKKIFSCFKGKTFEKLAQAKDLAFLSKKLATLDISVELNDFDINTFQFIPAEITSPEVLDLFRELEFHSLLGGVEEEKDLKTWKDTGLQVQIVGDKEGLESLMKMIYNLPESSFTPKEGSNTPPAHSSLPPQLRGIEEELT
ncbi:MAG: hypothetical protein H6767_02115 [Candidatus Peribacteria bacterium]|nr:MAG: hypothetical protein H6767_02115 [Candidatus Peribacteria bacterium]